MGNVKTFGNYQYIGGQMSDRDKREAGSKFWNKGKWDNFVLPLLPEDCSEMSLVDMGCNAGIFLKLAEDKGFGQVSGVDANKEAYKKGLKYRRKNNGKYRIFYMDMRNCIDVVPMADYTVFANSHYYFPIDDWLDYLDKLVAKTRYCIIVTAVKHEKYCKASAATENIKIYFNRWQEAGYIPPLPLEGDSYPRKLWTLCFKSPLIERVPIDSLDCGNHVQGRYYEALDKGVHPLRTRYYQILAKYRKHKWSEERLHKYMFDKVALYEDIKQYGLKQPIIVNSHNRIMEGNHRYKIWKHLGHKSILIRRT